MAATQGSTALNHDGEEVLAVVLLLNREDDQPEVDKETSLGLTALSWASRNGHIFVIEALLDYHAEINRASSKTGETALINAAKNGKWESVRLLLESGADVHIRDNTGRTATDWAREKNFAGVMKRYNFKGFIRSHGTHEFFRHGGSIGTRLTPGHVLKGKRCPDIWALNE